MLYDGMDGTPPPAPPFDPHKASWLLKHRIDGLEHGAALAADRVQRAQESLDRAEAEFERLEAMLLEARQAKARIEGELADGDDEPPCPELPEPGSRLMSATRVIRVFVLLPLVVATIAYAAMLAACR